MRCPGLCLLVLPNAELAPDVCEVLNVLRVVEQERLEASAKGEVEVEVEVRKGGEPDSLAVSQPQPQP